MNVVTQTRLNVAEIENQKNVKSLKRKSEWEQALREAAIKAKKVIMDKWEQDARETGKDKYCSIRNKLQEACEQGNERVVREILASGISPLDPYFHLSPLIKNACKIQNCSIVKLLKDNGLKIQNERQAEYVYWAYFGGGSKEITQLLLEDDDDAKWLLGFKDWKGNGIYELAEKRLDQEIMRLCLAKGYHPKTPEEQKDKAVSNKDKMEIADGNVFQDIEVACQGGRKDLFLKLLREHDISINDSQFSIPLITLACQNGQFEIAQYLVDNGLVIDPGSESVKCALYAYLKNNRDFTQLLFRKFENSCSSFLHAKNSFGITFIDLLETKQDREMQNFIRDLENRDPDFLVLQTKNNPSLIRKKLTDPKENNSLYTLAVNSSSPELARALIQLRILPFGMNKENQLPIEIALGAPDGMLPDILLFGDEISEDEFGQHVIHESYKTFFFEFVDQFYFAYKESMSFQAVFDKLVNILDGFKKYHSAQSVHIFIEQLKLVLNNQLEQLLNKPRENGEICLFDEEKDERNYLQDYEQDLTPLIGKFLKKQPLSAEEKQLLDDYASQIGEPFNNNPAEIFNLYVLKSTEDSHDVGSLFGSAKKVLLETKAQDIEVIHNYKMGLKQKVYEQLKQSKEPNRILNQQDNEGNTLFHLAVKQGDNFSIKIFMQYATPSLKNKQLQLPIDIALNNLDLNSEMIQILLFGEALEWQVSSQEMKTIPVLEEKHLVMFTNFCKKVLDDSKERVQEKEKLLLIVKAICIKIPELFVLYNHINSEKEEI